MFYPQWDIIESVQSVVVVLDAFVKLLDLLRVLVAVPPTVLQHFHHLPREALSLTFKLEVEKFVE
jgi:hypothetical protein